MLIPRLNLRGFSLFSWGASFLGLPQCEHTFSVAHFTVLADGGGTVVAAVSVSVLAHRSTGDLIAAFADLTKHATDNISVPLSKYAFVETQFTISYSNMLVFPESLEKEF
jgi:hypothetical protein